MRKLTILLIMLSLNALSQENIGFQTPPEEILQLVDINPQPAVRIDSDNRYLVILERRAFKDLEELAADEVRLAGLRINPQTHSPSRQGYFFGISISDLHRGKEIPIKGLPENPRLSDVMFSPDGNKLSFLQTQGTETQLWVIDLIQGSAVMMYRQKLNGCMGTPYFWGPDSETLFLKVIPQDREDTPGRKPLPSGPSIQVATGKKAPVKTFQDMLRTPYDEYLFEFYTRSTILQLKLDGSLTPFLPPAIYYSLSFSPDGKYLFIETLEKPFSYRVPFYRFPMRYSLHSETGEFLRTFYERPSTEDVLPGFDACEKGRREISWRNDHPATLVWAEALDGGDPAFQTDERDAIYQQEVAGESEPKKLTVTRYRFSGIVWGKEDLALLYEYWYKTRKTVTSILNPARPEAGKQVIFELSSEDLYADPGRFLTSRNAFNRQVLWITGNAKTLYLEGEG